MSVRADHAYTETVARYQSTVCQCGKPKKARHSFCSRCYFALPEPMRRPLFGTFGEEYELAYLRACDFLTGKSATQEASE